MATQEVAVGLAEAPSNVRRSTPALAPAQSSAAAAAAAAAFDCQGGLA